MPARNVRSTDVSVSSTPRPWPHPRLAAFALIDAPPTPNRSISLTLLLACPHPSATNWRDRRDRTRRIDAPDGACSRFPGVARLRVRDGADRCCDRRLTHDRCLEQALPANPPPEIAGSRQPARRDRCTPNARFIPCAALLYLLTDGGLRVAPSSRTTYTTDASRLSALRTPCSLPHFSSNPRVSGDARSRPGARS